MVAFTFLYEKSIIGLLKIFFISSKVLIVSIILGVEIAKSLVSLCVFVVVAVLYNACIH